MRRIFTLVALLFCAVPFGVSLAGCGGSTASGTFCSGSSGPRVGQVAKVTLLPQTGDISLNYAQTTSLTAPTATDCRGSAVSISKIVYSTGDAATNGILDVNPSGGLCAGLWNRNSPGNIADYTNCLTTGKSGVASVTATANGVGSNQILVYVHPIVTDIELGAPSIDCVGDPATNCPKYGSIAVPLTTTVSPYNPNDCLSFGKSAQLVARFFDGPASTAGTNITYIAGHAQFTAQTSGLVTINTDGSGIITASAPGSTVVTAGLGGVNGSNPTTTSNAGVVSVCAPKSITINTLNAVNGNVSVNVGSTENIVATVVDTKGVTVTGLNLTYNSTNPVTTIASSGGIIPVFAGGAGVNALCLPPSCNPSPLASIGRYPNGSPSGNGKPVSSNNITVTTPGTSSSLIWVASTDSLYLLPIDLTAGTIPTPTRLPFVPNSMVLTQTGSAIYLGSANGLMTFTTGGNSVTGTNIALQGPVLAASPDGNNVIVTDPLRKTVSLATVSTGTVVSSFAGVGTRAAFTPDGLTVYVVTADNHLLVYSTETSWHQYDLSAAGAVNDVIAAIPAVGAFIGTATSVNGRSYCPNTTTATTDYYPQALNTTLSAAVGDRLAATNDGKHLLDVRLATANGTPVINDLLLGAGAGLPVQECPEDGSTPAFTAAVNTTVATGLAAGTVTGLYPSSDSSLAVITNTAATGQSNTTATVALYRPAASGAGTVSSIKLANGATAAVAGAISTDNRFFYAGTSGDNLLHYLTIGTLADTKQINPQLPSVSAGGTAVPNLIVLRPRTALVAGQ